MISCGKEWTLSSHPFFLVEAQTFLRTSIYQKKCSKTPKLSAKLFPSEAASDGAVDMEDKHVTRSWFAYLEVSVEHHYFLCRDEEVNFGGRLTFTIRRLKESKLFYLWKKTNPVEAKKTSLGHWTRWEWKKAFEKAFSQNWLFKASSLMARNEQLLGSSEVRKWLKS